MTSGARLLVPEGEFHNAAAATRVVAATSVPVCTRRSPSLDHWPKLPFGSAALTVESETLHIRSTADCQYSTAPATVATLTSHHQQIESIESIDPIFSIRRAGSRPHLLVTVTLLPRNSEITLTIDTIALNPLETNRHFCVTLFCVLFIVERYCILLRIFIIDVVRSHLHSRLY